MTVMRAPFSLIYGPQTFQTFVDTKGAEGIIPQQFHGTYSIWHDELRAENAKGAGIYYTVNLTALAERCWDKGETSRKSARNATDIVEVRAWYTDIDGISNHKVKNSVIRQLLEHPVGPSCIIVTKNGVHALWYAMPGTKPNLEEYRRTEEGIIHHWGGDRSVKDIARVLRLPGFQHRKDPNDPFDVVVAFEDDTAYFDEEQIREAFPPPEQAPRHVGYDYSATYDAGDDWKVVVGSIAAWPPIATQRHLVMTLALGVAVKFGVPESDAVADLEPVVLQWQTGRNMAVELARTARWAYSRQQPATVAALRNLGVRIPKLSKPSNND